MTHIRIEIFGPNAESLEADLQTLIKELFGEAGGRVQPGSIDTKGTRVDPATVIAIAALVLSLPGSINSTLDLAERIKLKAKFKRLIEWARSKVDGGHRITLISGKGTLELPEADESEVMEHIEKSVDNFSEKQ